MLNCEAKLCSCRECQLSKWHVTAAATQLFFTLPEHCGLQAAQTTSECGLSDHVCSIILLPKLRRCLFAYIRRDWMSTSYSRRMWRRNIMLGWSPVLNAAHFWLDHPGSWSLVEKFWRTSVLNLLWVELQSYSLTFTRWLACMETKGPVNSFLSYVFITFLFDEIKQHGSGWKKKRKKKRSHCFPSQYCETNVGFCDRAQPSVEQTVNLLATADITLRDKVDETAKEKSLFCN